MKWLLRRYMDNQHIDSFLELSRLTGINEQTLRNRINNTRQLRVFELEQLDSILHFKEEDLIQIIRGQFK